MTRHGILAAGNWIVDRVKLIDVYPAQDTLANISGEARGTGGAPFNVLVDLARLGAPFPLAGAGLVGDDADGAWIREVLRGHGIDQRLLRVHPGAPTSYTDVMTVRASGRRTFFHQRGANAFFGPGHLDFAGRPEKHFHLGYLLLLDALDQPDPETGTASARLLRAARAAGLRTSVDVVSEDGDRYGRLVLPALRHVDYCVLNEFEAARATGLAVRRPDAGESLDREALHRAAGRLLEAGVGAWVVIHFPEGALARGADGTVLTQARVDLPAGQIAGTVGAGDAFAAGLLYGLHEERPMADCLRYAVCAAAASLTAPTGTDGVRPLADCLALAGGAAQPA